MRRIQLALNISTAPPGCDPEMTLCPCCDGFWNYQNIDPLPLPPRQHQQQQQQNQHQQNQQQQHHPNPQPARQAPLPSSDYSAAAAGMMAPVQHHPNPPANQWPAPNGQMINGQVPPAGPNGQPIPTCNCPLPSAVRTTNKPGANQGRQFYCCPKPQDEGCRFFQWTDEPPRGGGGGGQDGGRRGDLSPTLSAGVPRS